MKIGRSDQYFTMIDVGHRNSDDDSTDYTFHVYQWYGQLDQLWKLYLAELLLFLRWNVRKKREMK